MGDPFHSVVTADERILRFEVVCEGRSDIITANKFFHDGIFVHFWLTDYPRALDTAVTTVRADRIDSIRPIYGAPGGGILIPPGGVPDATEELRAAWDRSKSPKDGEHHG